MKTFPVFMAKILGLAVVLSLSSSSPTRADEGFTLPTEKPAAKKSEPIEKMLNLRVEPHWLLLTELNVDAQFRLGSHFSFGPTFAYLFAGSGIFYGPSVSTSSAYSDKTTRPFYGVRGAAYFMGVDRHSVYLAGFAKFGKTSVTRKPDASFNASDPERKGDFSESVAGATVGFQWVLKTLTFNVGGGVAFYNHPTTLNLVGTDGTTTPYDLGENEVSFALDAGLGFRF